MLPSSSAASPAVAIAPSGTVRPGARALRHLFRAIRPAIAAWLGLWSRRSTGPALVGWATIAIVLVLRVLDPPLLVEARLAVFDGFQRAAPRPYEPLPVRVIDIDDATLARVGQWPWPRRDVARLVERLTGLGAATIVIDAVFAEPDRVSPRALATAWASDPQLAETLLEPELLPDFDEELAEAFARSRVVTSLGLTNEPNDATAPVKGGLAMLGPDPAQFLRHFPGAVTNLPLLDQAASGSGTFSVGAGGDQIIRRVPLLYRLNDQVLPSISLEALRVAQGASTIKIRSRDGGAALRLGQRPGIERIGVGRLEVPVTSDGHLWVHYSEDVPERTLSAWRILAAGAADDQELRERVAGNIVLVGTSAVGLKDLRATPLNPFEAGVVVHAQVIEQMLLGWFLDRPAWAGGLEITGSIALGLVLTFLLLRVHPAAAGGMAAAACIIAGGGAYVAFTEQRLLIDPIHPILTVLAVYLSVTVMTYLRAEREKGEIRQAFSHYLAPALVDHLVERPGRLVLGGEMREITFLFSDIAGFTGFTEQCDPERLVLLLNAYLDGQCGIVMDHGGTVDKIVGDAIHAMFNAPLEQNDHAARAVACALAMDAFARRFVAEQAGRGIRFGATRIGINTGRAVVGNFGGARRFDYTAHGDAINTAARLESVNKHLGTRICVAGSTAAACPDQAFRAIGTLVLKGKQTGVEAFEPVTPEEDASLRVVLYREALDALAEGRDAAPALFAELTARFPEDPLVALHAARSARGEVGTTIVLAEK